jgi:hypothetical protein
LNRKSLLSVSSDVLYLVVMNQKILIRTILSHDTEKTHNIL